ncbi:MAG TPA: enoyl-CoA hydratase-related protein [candidate division Zixibacteria bacterium]|nr:enoyl-CoA hydratase-related protein [candidate division Zixibacteria bacterium]
MSYETILYDVKDSVATITLNRPKALNAFNTEMIGETTNAFKQAGRDKAVRCIIITGSGRAFSSGQDLKDVEERGEDFSIGDHIRQGYNRLILQMVNLEKPIVAAVNGIAAGAGCGIALAADIRIASEYGSFMLAFSKVGLVPDSGTTWMLPRIVGYSRAYEMAITAEKISAERAFELGLVNKVVPAAQFEEIVAAWTGMLACGPTLAFGLTKRAMYHSATRTLEESLEFESMMQDLADRSRDREEGVQAFIEKRTPKFLGE